MSQLRFIPLGKYLEHVKGLFYTNLLPVVLPPGTISQTSTLQGVSLIVEIPFRDGSWFKAAESLVRRAQHHEVNRYFYEFQTPAGYFFHFEMEEPESSPDAPPPTEPQASILKPRFHLHVGAKKEVADTIAGFPRPLREHDGPHYRSSPVTIDFVLAMVIVNFYPEHTSIIRTLELAEFRNRPR